jgi:hypothetical protein
MTAPSVGAIRYVLLFALLYYVLMTIVGLAFIAGGVHPSGMNIIVLILVSTCVALLFIRKHRRLFSIGEYLTVVIGSIMVDVAVELGIVALRGGQITIDQWPIMAMVFGGHALLLAVAYLPWSWIVRGYARRVTGP